MMRIVEFGLPATFPELAVPVAAAEFCAEVDGMEFSDAVALADEQGLAPITRPLPNIGHDIWGFGLDFEGCNVPFLVRVQEDDGGQSHAVH